MIYQNWGKIKPFPPPIAYDVSLRAFQMSNDKLGVGELMGVYEMVDDKLMPRCIMGWGRD